MTRKETSYGQETDFEDSDRRSGVRAFRRRRCVRVPTRSRPRHYDERKASCRRARGISLPLLGFSPLRVRLSASFLLPDLRRRPMVLLGRAIPRPRLERRRSRTLRRVASAGARLDGEAELVNSVDFPKRAEPGVRVAVARRKSRSRGGGRPADPVPPRSAAARAASRLARRVVPVEAPLVDDGSHVEQPVSVRRALPDLPGAVERPLRNLPCRRGISPRGAR